MIKKVIIILVVIIISVSAFLMLNKPVLENQVISVIPVGEPVFGWKYLTLEKEGIPQTTISILATYPDSTEIIKEIDIIQGECNEHVTPDADVYQNSKMIICYYAGLGHYFKVVEGDGKYLVQRKVFEEASPEYNPPAQDFETVAEF